MAASWLVTTTLVSILLANLVEAEIKPYIITHTDIPTECKTCPHTLCPNVQNDDVELGAFSVTCWAHGTKIMGDDLWLKTELGCYVTQYDVAEYDGDYTTDLAYCGRDSEQEDLTIEDATTKYKTECRICPWLRCDTASYLLENVDLELTCWVPDGQTIIDDPIWMKTTNNCYVAQKNLYSKPDITYLDPCGPIPHLELVDHNNENGTSEVDKRDAGARTALELASRGLMYLVNVTVGEEYAECRSCPNDSCESVKTYEFDQEVWLQCLVRNDNDTTYWSETTDFCYMKSADFWQSPEGDNYRFPRCDMFTNPGDSPGDEDKRRK